MLMQAQDYLNSSYPEGQRREEKTLEINNQNLEGTLDLKDFENLESLDCSYNQLSSTNFLSTLPFPEKLIYLNISNNNFTEDDLSFLSKFVELEELRLGTFDENRINQGIYNRFCGSLKSLRNMNRLETLEISNTDIDSGYEYLPLNVRTIISSSQMRPEAKVEKIDDALSPYRSDGNWEVDIGSARINFWETHGLEKIDELERLIDDLNSKNVNLKSENAKLISENTNLESENAKLNSENTDLKSENVNLNLKNDTLNSRIDKLTGIGVDLLNDWNELHNNKQQLITIVDELKKQLELKDEELKKAREANDETAIMKLMQEIEKLKESLAEKEKEIAKLEENEKTITELVKSKEELKKLKEGFLTKIDKMKRFSDQKEAISNQVDKFLELIESNEISFKKSEKYKKHTDEVKSIKTETDNIRKELAKFGLAKELNDLSNKQRDVTKKELKLQEIKDIKKSLQG
ncbi:hypothetical protein C1645_734649 [Glomus cerebriforme]|uniref:Uncharacterized protein n=1 Tax=Glomus cerebriforme TaxID=658196 RepID=A0A397TI42_9GLOM|nr:hypothetical protein C1645_734649 [Glomus cerebriforme]